jgi:hypothetical protein
MRRFKKFLSKLKTRRDGRNVNLGANIPIPPPNDDPAPRPGRNVSTPTPNAGPGANPRGSVSTPRNAATVDDNVSETTPEGDDISATTSESDDISATTSESDDASTTEISIVAWDARGQRALHHAARHNNSAAVSRLLYRGANISAEDYKGRTALHIAAARGHVECTRILIDSGASLTSRTNTRSREGGSNMTPIMMARSNGHRDIVNMIRTHVGLPKVAEDRPLMPESGFSGRSYYNSERVGYGYGASSGGLWSPYTVRNPRSGEQEEVSPNDIRYWD